MRIIIEIDGEDVTVRTERMPTHQRVRASGEPPPEALRSAAALGAASAGPAPVDADLQDLGTEASHADVGAIAEAADAGAGPFPPPRVLSDDVEYPVGEAEGTQS
jgi:hypothetical protein